MDMGAVYAFSGTPSGGPVAWSFGNLQPEEDRER
jgi:hypothetical protein